MAENSAKRRKVEQESKPETIQDEQERANRLSLLQRAASIPSSTSTSNPYNSPIAWSNQNLIARSHSFSIKNHNTNQLDLIPSILLFPFSSNPSSQSTTNSFSLQPPNPTQYHPPNQITFSKSGNSLLAFFPFKAIGQDAQSRGNGGTLFIWVKNQFAALNDWNLLQQFHLLPSKKLETNEGFLEKGFGLKGKERETQGQVDGLDFLLSSPDSILMDGDEASLREIIWLGSTRKVSSNVLDHCLFIPSTAFLMIRRQLQPQDKAYDLQTSTLTQFLI